MPRLEIAMAAALDPASAWKPFEPDGEVAWSQATAAHLFRRAGFGATTRELAEAAAKKPQEVIEALVARGRETPEFRAEMDLLAASAVAGGNPQQLVAWWLYRMLNTPDPHLEKLTLFWHGHFATSAAKVDRVKLMLAQNEMLRKHARGDFGQMVLAIARDPAMLIYLDSATNRKTAPNENFAREVMELFCLGLGNYTEKDIQELARCYTGWEVRDGAFEFNKFQHDTGVKKVLGQSGAFGGEEGTKVVLDQPAAARFIVGKLYRFFIADEPAPPAELLEPLAEQYRRSGYQTGPVVRTMLGSRHFFSNAALGKKIRSPVELTIGTLRALEGRTNLQKLTQQLDGLGQLPFFPPSVKGWDGGRTWINSSMLLARANLVRMLVTADESRFGGGTLADLARRHEAEEPEAMVAWLLALLVAVPPPDGVRQSLVELARSRSEVKGRATDVLSALAALPEFQLS
jgi:uncharacterized protein (DUF1800 family)